MRHDGEEGKLIPQYPDSKLLIARQPEICELSFSNLTIWSDFDRPQATMMNNCLCIQINPINEEPYFLEPLGCKDVSGTIEECLAHSTKLSRLSEKFAATLDQSKYKITNLRSHNDYIYLVKDLAELKGKQFDGKRNHIKRFKTSHPDHSFVALGKSHEKQCLDLFEKWFDSKKDMKFFSKLAHDAQRKALEKAFANFSELGLIGGAIEDKGSLLGFIMGSRLNKKMVSAHFSYTDPGTQGLSQAILNEACVKTFATFEEINLEQDLGIPGLRQAKLSYHPIRLEKKFELLPVKDQA
jgi:hypothetical protein